MYGGDLSGGAVGGSSWKAPEDPGLIVGGKEEVSLDRKIYSEGPT